MLQQFDNNVDKAVQAFMDGEYNVPLSLMQVRFNHMPKYSLSLVAQNMFCSSSEIWCVTLVNYKKKDPPVCIFAFSHYKFDMAAHLFYLAFPFLKPFLLQTLFFILHES